MDPKTVKTLNNALTLAGYAMIGLITYSSYSYRQMNRRIAQHEQEMKKLSEITIKGMPQLTKNV